MDIKLTGKFLGEARETKKQNGYTRRFLHNGNDLFTVFSKDPAKLEGDTVVVNCGDFVFAK